jgi:single-stranded-DNA-specific exonuclease
LPFPSKRWKTAEAVSPPQLSRFAGLPPLVVQLLHNRKIRTPGEAESFLARRTAGTSPFALKGMNEAVARLRQAIRREEPIAVYGDFDADGVTATVLLVEVLTDLGARVEPYIPHRVDEGYGLNLDALRMLYSKGVRVVVTVDCGIRSIREVEEARRGLDLIVTDHHRPGPELPATVATINPKQAECPYPFKELSGVGVAFKLAQALLRVSEQMGRPDTITEEGLLDLVAVGTVADLAQLLSENRSLVWRGMAGVNSSPRPGVEALMADAGLRRGEVDATAIGFRLGPRLNAAGRIDNAMLAYQLLASRDALETRALATRLGALNQQRQELTEKTVAAAEAQVLADHPDADLYVAASKEFKAGIVGLAASRLTETYYRPSIVVELGEQESRGSCRSIPEFDITRALEQCADLLIRFGGHRAAAGFAVATEKLDTLRRRLQGIAAEQLTGLDRRPTLQIDAEVALEEVDWSTHELLRQMEPCGVDNPQPVLLSQGVEVRERRAIGSEQQHLKLLLRDGRGAAWDAVWFRQASRGGLAGQVPDRVDVAYTLEVNEWNGQRRLQLNIQDLRGTEGPISGA